MLPNSYIGAYRELLILLQQLRDRVETDNFELLQDNFSQIQQLFQQQIASLTGDELESDVFSQWQSVQTEIHRSLRLLQTDLMFLRSSRQATTSAARLKSVVDRLDKLIGYCRLSIEQ